MTSWSLSSFCGALGWLVVAQSMWCNPCLPLATINTDEPDTACLITHLDTSELHCVVQADDGRIYDAVALRVWLQQCQRDQRPMCVIPDMPITCVRPVRVRRPRVLSVVPAHGESKHDEEVSGLAGTDGNARTVSTQSVGTQTSEVCAESRPVHHDAAQPPTTSSGMLPASHRIRPAPRHLRIPSSHSAFRRPGENASVQV